MNKIIFITGFLLSLSFLPLSLAGQDVDIPLETPRNRAVRVFLDCRTCDMNYTRQEIPYINYVRDVKEAQVFILVTDQGAGNGGRQYTYRFQGMGQYAGMNDTLVYSSNPDLTSAIIREHRTNILKMGLMRYVARTPMISEITISHNRELETEEVIDKWNNWIFEFQTSPRYNAEQSYRRLFVRNSVEISKVTPDIKLEIDISQDLNRQRFIKEDEDITYIRSSESLSFLFVKSLGEHWSAGLRWNMGASTSANYKFNQEFLPSVEYDLYPYSLATHKQLRIMYSAGYQYSSYIDTSIYNLTKENLFKQELRLAYQIQEKWGSVNLSLTGSNYFNDFSKNSVLLNGFVRIRVVRGLSFSVNGEVAYINDQLNLRKGNLSEAERLLRLKQQATKFQIGGGLSITYTFGSIYNNVVNPRFGRTGGGGGGGGGGGFF